MACINAEDCQLLGKCINGSCICAPGFKGPNCGLLDLQPAASLQAATIWPKAGARNSSAWGFTTAYDPIKQMYHAVVDVSCGCAAHSSIRDCTEFTGVLASGGYASTLVHLSSPHPDRDFHLVNVISPPSSFNPHLVIAPDSSFALYFRVNALAPLPVCAGNSSGPTNGMQHNALIKACDNINKMNCIHAGGSETGTNMYLATAKSMTGPWKVQKVVVVGEGGLHVSNPSVAFVDKRSLAAKFGSVVMAFRYNSVHGETNGVAYSKKNAAGPFKVVANLTCHGCEDPFIWQQNDGSMHMIYHNHANSYHAWSADGVSWSENDQTPMFSTRFTIVGGHSLQLRRRERPELVFDFETGAPLALLNGASADDTSGIYRAFSLLQEIVR